MRALAHRNYRFYFVGQAVSILGSWIQQVSLSWLVYRITGSAALLGVTAFCALVPQLLVGPLAGAWIDKQDKKKWLVVVQGALALQGFALAALTWAGLVGPVFLIAMSLTLGLLNSFDTPLRQSLIGSFVGRRDGYHPSLLLGIYIYGYRLGKVSTRERIRVSSLLHVTDESNTFGVGAQNDIDFPLDQRFVGKRFIIDQA